MLTFGQSIVGGAGSFYRFFIRQCHFIRGRKFVQSFGYGISCGFISGGLFQILNRRFRIGELLHCGFIYQSLLAFGETIISSTSSFYRFLILQSYFICSRKFIQRCSYRISGGFIGSNLFQILNGGFGIGKLLQQFFRNLCLLFLG